MRIASAQIESIIRRTNENLNRHLELIDVAGEKSVDLIFFPEMSLTGYCREEGKELSLSASSEEIKMLKEKAALYDMIIVVGAPVSIKNQLYIGSFILHPTGETALYTKQYLHLGEEIYFSSSFDYNPHLHIGSEKIGFAICADIANSSHPIKAKENECTLYLPSIFYSKDGIKDGQKLLSHYARENSFSILMSNYSGFLWGVEAGGKSGFWNENGELLAALGEKDEGLLIIEKGCDKWLVEKYIDYRIAR